MEEIEMRLIYLQEKKWIKIINAWFLFIFHQNVKTEMQYYFSLTILPIIIFVSLQTTAAPIPLGGQSRSPRDYLYNQGL